MSVGLRTSQNGSGCLIKTMDSGFNRIVKIGKYRGDVFLYTYIITHTLSIIETLIEELRILYDLNPLLMNFRKGIEPNNQCWSCTLLSAVR